MKSGTASANNLRHTNPRNTQLVRFVNRALGAGLRLFEYLYTRCKIKLMRSSPTTIKNGGQKT